MEQHRQHIRSLTEDLPPLPDFSYFHPAFCPDPASAEGDIRHAYFLAYNEELYEFLRIDGAVQTALQAGRQVVSASFVIPYPPGFPILVPGQVISQEILDFMVALDVKEIHGYKPELGLRVFKEEALASLSQTNPGKENNQLPESQRPVDSNASRVKKRNRTNAR
jgi:arginine decarboxylase